LSRDTSSTLSPLPAVGLADPDPELLALPAPPKKERTATVSLMLVTAVASLAMAFSLRGEALYAVSAGTPAELGALASVELTPAIDNRYVRGEGLLGTAGAIRYGRAAEGDSFRLAPVAGNPSVWVEIRVPEGFEGPRFVPPTTFAGRLVPLDEAGIRHVGLRRAVQKQTGEAVPDRAWVLIDGASPRASRWALALAMLFAGFAAWNLAGIARLLRRTRS
jgi:hypothetical protein